MPHISAIDLPNGDSYDIKGKGTVPLMSKTFTSQDASGTGIYGSTNNQTGATFYFGKVRPDTFSTPWSLTYRINVSCEAYSNYVQEAVVTLLGCGNTRSGYEANAAIYNTSTRPAQYNTLYSITSTGFSNGYGNLIGVGLASSMNPISSSYPRTISVDILNVTGGTFSFFDYALKYANVPGTGTTNFSGISEYNFYTNGHVPDANDVYTLRLEANKVYAGTNGIYPYTLVALDKEGRFQSFTLSGDISTTKEINTSAKFKLDPVIYYYGANNSATNGNLVSSTYATYSVNVNLDLRHSTNCTTTQFATYSPIYIECTIDNDGYWSPTANCITQTLQQGYYYIYLGQTYSNAYQLSLQPFHPVYYYDGTNLTSKYEYTYNNKLIFGNITVESDLWQKDTAISLYPYRALISCPGVNSNHYAFVEFDYADLISGNLAPRSETISDGIYIYAAEKPKEAINILSITCT